MARLVFRQAVQADHAALERLFERTPMGHHIRLVSDRSPDFFATTRVQSTSAEVHGYFDQTGEAAAVLSAGLRDVWLDGVRPMRYLSDLRIDPDHQGGGLLGRGFARLRKQVMAAGEWAQTLVLEDNRKALALLLSGRAGLPEYRPAGRYASWLMPPQRRAPVPGIQVRPAGVDDLESMSQLYTAAARRRSFAPMIDFGVFQQPAASIAYLGGLQLADFLVAERQGHVVGMMGLWDQGPWQRLRVQGYSRLVRALRPVWNCFARLPLPPPGETMAMKKLTAVACRDDDPAVLVALLADALGSTTMPLLGGCSVRDPLASGYAACKAHRAGGRHFLVGWQGAPPAWREPFAFDVARI